MPAATETTTRPTDAADATGERPPTAARSNGLARLASWRIWIASAALFVPFALVFFASSAPFSIPEVEATCGSAPPDMRLFTSGEGVTNFLDACGPAGRSAYRNLQLADLFYPAVVGVFLASSLALAIKGLSPEAGAVRWLAALPLLATAFDYLENAFAWLALTAYPDPIGTNDILGVASAAKTTTSWAGGITLLVCLVALVVQAGRSRVSHPG